MHQPMINKKKLVSLPTMYVDTDLAGARGGATGAGVGEKKFEGAGGRQTETVADGAPTRDRLVDTRI